MGAMANARGFAADNRIRVLVAHARADSAFAAQIGAFLRDAGFQPWLEREGGGDWDENTVAEADAVVVVLTEAALRSELCLLAAEEAQSQDKRVVLVAPEPLRGASGAFGGQNTICFYSDPAIPSSGFYDGQRRLEATLREGERASAFAVSPRDEARAARRAAAQARREEKRVRKTEQRELERQIRRATAPRFPTARVLFLGFIALAVVGVIAKPELIGDAQSAWTSMTTAAAELTETEEPYSALDVSVEDYTPERPLYAGRNGANVRDYPLTTGELLYDAPARTPMRVTGRRMVQGQWWFRVELEDGRIGFVREDVATFSAPRGAPSAVANVTAISPAIAINAGSAGAKVRTAPRRNASVIVRVPAATEMQTNGKVRAGGHWWLRVRLADGRTGFVRDDVVTEQSRAAALGT